MMVRHLPSLNNEKKDQIRSMFFALKIFALFFSIIPILQYFSDRFHLDFTNYNVYSLGITFIICILMSFLMFVYKRNEHKKILQLLEMIIFFIVFIIVIYVSGASTSNNKFIFLFIIISYTIEYGMNTGMGIASASTLVIIGMDLVFGGTKGINIPFENDLALIAMFYLITWTLGFYVKMERLHIKDLTDYANLDGLTGAYNYRYFYEKIELCCEESKKYGTELSLQMIDIDYFKKYNDMYGHYKGDELLKEITNVFRSLLRETDILCRYGGDEFCIIMQNTDRDEAIHLANTVREAVNEYDCFGKEYLKNGKMTISVGVSTYNKENENYKDFIENADMALYRAKFLRRNKVEVYSSIYEQAKENTLDNTLIEAMKPLKTLITVINSRDSYTYKHVERVYHYCRIISEHLKLAKEERRILLYAAYLHDLGKINVSKEVLISSSKLTKEEWEELKKHPQDSADILTQIKGFEKVVPIVLEHHEKYDGTGYPKGLKGEEISYLARILTVADSFDAMTNQRTYQKRKTFHEAFEEIERCKGTHFDPEIADQFIEALKRI